MNKVDLGQAMNTLANAGVIVGIAFLALELHQNNELMESESRATIAGMNTEIWATTSEIPDIAEMAVKDRTGEGLTRQEEFRLNAIWVRALYNAEYTFEEVPQRFPTEMWRRAYVTYGSLRRAWTGGGPGSALAGKDMYTEAFVEFMEASAFRPQEGSDCASAKR